MPEGEGYGPQTTASVGPTLNYIGRHVYAYSGNQTLPADTLVKQLDFTISSEYILGAFNWSTGETSATRDVYIEIHFNGIQVYVSRWDTSNQNPIQSSPLPLVIPPFTRVECYQKNDGTTSGCFIMTGRVYK